MTQYTPAQARELADSIQRDAIDDFFEVENALRSLADQLEQTAPAVPAPGASARSSVMQLSELMRGLELPPTCATAQPAMLYEIGRAIAAQAREAAKRPQAAPVAQLSEPPAQPSLKVRLTAFPESNGKRNWTALLVREEHWDGLVGNCGGISLARGELWNRVAWEAECARFLIGERSTEPSILDYGEDIRTPEEWKGEVDRVRRAAAPTTPKDAP